MPAIAMPIEAPVEVPVNIMLFDGAISVRMKPTSFNLWLSALLRNRACIYSPTNDIKVFGDKYHIKYNNQYVPLTIDHLLELNDTHISTEFLEDFDHDNYHEDDNVHQLGVLLNTFVSLIES
jgi:hypothetical protein